MGKNYHTEGEVLQLIEISPEGITHCEICHQAGEEQMWLIDVPELEPHGQAYVCCVAEARYAVWAKNKEET